MPTNARFARESLWVNPDSLNEVLRGSRQVYYRLWYPSVNLKGRICFTDKVRFGKMPLQTRSDGQVKPRATLRTAADMLRLRVNFCAFSTNSFLFSCIDSNSSRPSRPLGLARLSRVVPRRSIPSRLCFRIHVSTLFTNSRDFSSNHVRLLPHSLGRVRRRTCARLR